MSVLSNRRVVVSLVVFLVSAVLTALVVGYLGLLFVTAQLTVGLLLERALVFLPILAVLLVVMVLSGLALVWTVLRNLSLPRSERLQSVAERAEQSNSTLSALGLSEYVSPPEPTDEEKLAEVKRRYVEGEIDEDEFEREIERLESSRSPDDRTHESRDAEREY